MSAPKLSYEELARRLAKAEAALAALRDGHPGGNGPAKTAPEEPRAFLERIAAIAPVGIFVYDVNEQRTIFGNPAYEAHLGYTLDEIQALGPTLLEAIYHPDARERLRKHDAALLADRDGRVFEAEYQIRHKDGSTRWARTWEVVLSRNPDGSPAQVLGIGLDTTERKRTEAALAKSQERLESIFRVAPVGIGLVANRVILEVNDRICAMTGYSRQELVGQDARRLYPTEADYEYVGTEKYWQIAETGTGTVETRWLCKDGRVRDVLLTSTDVDPGNPAAGVTFTALDITARQRAEAALRESERILRATGRIGKIGGWDHDLATGKAVWTEATYDIVGIPYDQEPPGPDEHLDYYPPEDREILRTAYEQAVADGTPFDLELRCHTADGRRIWCRAQGEPVHRDGVCVHMRGAFQDITQRKQAEAALRESERQKNLVLEATSEMVAYYDTDLRVLWANQASAASVDASPEDLVGRHCYAIWHGRDAPCENCPVLSAMETRMPARGEQQTPDGRWWLLRGYPILDDGDGDRVIGFAEFGLDITARKRVEAEREALQEQLVQTRKLESVGRLAGGVAHDFNNMLSVILGNAELALQAPDDPDALRENLDAIRRAARRSADLTRQLLAFARRQTARPRVLDLNKTVGDTMRMLRRLIGENVDLVWEPGAALWPVKIDPAQVDQMLANLCMNARGAIDDAGRVTLQAHNVHVDAAIAAAHAEAEPGDYVMLSIEDTGCGMDAETLAHIFEPFYTTKDVGQGAGLGLATVYGVIRQNGGFVGVTSEPGRGTRFELYLPRYRGEAEEASPETGPAAVPRGHETVLLVEEEASVLELSERLVSGLGYTGLAARTPHEAMEAAEGYDGRIDLLVTDVIMPEMNGAALAKAVARQHRGLRTLFISGYPADHVAHHGVLADGMHFLQKPFSRDGLAAALRTALDGE